MQTKLNLPALLGARICHDMISPVGAISNGLELLTLTGDTSGPEAALVSESVNSANARLKFFRLAFGPGGDEQLISSAELISILSGYYDQAGLDVRLTDKDQLSKSDAKLLLLLTLCCESGMGRRGQISMTSDMSLECQGEALPDAHPLWAQLCSDGNWPEGLEPALVQFPLAFLALKEAGLRLCCAKQAQSYQIWTEPAVSGLIINREPYRPLQQGT